MSITTIKKMIRAAARVGGIGVRPKGFCFITGCPRSGTTALGEWIDLQSGIVQMNETRILVAAHAMVEKALAFKDLSNRKQTLSKELRYLVMDYYASRRFIGRNMVIDKEPLEPIAFPDKDYAAFLESVRFIFPDVKLLFIIREPLATIWSMRNRKWGYTRVNYEPRDFTLEESIQIWNDNARIISEYQAMPNTYLCKFELLISDPEESKRITDFLGVKLNAVFDPHPTKKVNFPDEEESLILEGTKEFRKVFSY